VRTLGVVVAIAAAIAAQLGLARFAIAGGREVDLVLVLVTFVGLRMGPLPGLLTGSVAGITQDVLSGSLVGVGGLAKSIVGFVAGMTGQQFIVNHSLPRFFVFVCATVVQAACFLGVYGLLDPRSVQAPYGELATQAVGNGLVGVLLFKVVEVVPGLAARQRARRRSKRRW
jgi:rod shape-determining protein MreD